MGGGAHLLRDPLALPRPPGPRVDPRSGRPVGDPAADRESLDGGPGPAKEILASALENLQGAQGAATVAFIIGLAAAIWSASGYVGSFMEASNSIWEVEEGRPRWKKLSVRLGITVVRLLLLAITAILVVVTGPIAEQAGSLIGVGDTAVSVWGIAKWPVLLVLVSFMFALLYWAAPNVEQPGFQWMSPGNIAIRFGAEFNAELARAADRRRPPAREGAVPPAARRAQARLSGGPQAPLSPDLVPGVYGGRFGARGETRLPSVPLFGTFGHLDRRRLDASRPRHQRCYRRLIFRGAR